MSDTYILDVRWITKSWILWTIIILVIIFLIWLFFSEKNVQKDGDTLNNTSYDEIRSYLNNSNEIEPYINLDNNLEEYIDNNEEFIFNHERPFKTIGERYSCKALETYLGREVLVNSRPNFLVNPKTGQPLEYDCFDPISNIAVEYNGEQHYNFPNGFHKTEKEFKDQIFRDEIKKKISEDYGIKLISIPFTVDTCKESSRSKKGYTNLKGIDVKYREEKIKEFLYSELDSFYEICEV